MRVPNAQHFLHLFRMYRYTIFLAEKLKKECDWQIGWLDVRKTWELTDKLKNVNEGRKNCQTDRTKLMVRESNIGTCEVTDGFC